MLNQVEMVVLEDLVPYEHVYRKFSSLWKFDAVVRRLKYLEKDNNYKGYGYLRLFKCLLLQFMEDLSDRELERFLQENNAAKWFCGFSLVEATPSFGLFTKIRSKIGARVLSRLFADLRNQLKSTGYISEVFTFVDASHLIAKSNLWKERDQAIKEKYEKFNNEVLPKVAYDKQARIGCKGQDKYWYGYKQHTSVDMQSGLINKIAITPANITDSAGFKHVCPSQGAAYTDKGYCDKNSKQTAARKNVHLAAILKNNMHDKNPDKDRFYSKIRAPYERVFANQNKRVRYCGIAKNQFAAFMIAICFNLKRLAILDPPSFSLA